MPSGSPKGKAPGPSRSESLEREGIAVLNLRPVFSRAEDQGRRLHYRLDMHWNARGHAEAARAIAAGLEARGWLDEGGLPPGA